MTDIRGILREEMDELERQLEADPRFQKLQKLQNLLALYEDDADYKPAPMRARASRGSANDRDRALRMTEELLQDRRHPTRTADILTHLQQNGVTIDGQSPVSNLSAMLSRAPQFESHGRSGWTLVESEEDLLAARGLQSSHGASSEEDVTNLA